MLEQCSSRVLYVRSRVPYWASNFRFFINDTFFGNKDDIAGANTGYFFFYNADPCNYGYHAVYKNETV